MKFRILGICAASLATLMTANPAVSAPPHRGGSGGSCATVSIYATNASATVAPGGTIGLTGKYQNCSSRKARYTYNLSAISSCGQKVDLAAGRVAFDPGQARIWSVSYQFPLNTCQGDWTATMTVSDKSRTLASASTIVTIF